jgi:cell division protein FtsW (lipid II flippase)
MTPSSGTRAAATARAHREQRSRWLFLIPVALIVPTAVFCISSARERGEPYVQLVGHYAPDLQPVIQIGSGPQADLRLTEADIDPLEGGLRIGDNAFSYEHGSPTSYVKVVTDEATGQITRAVELEDGDTIEVAGPGRRSTHTVQLIDAQRLALQTWRGDYEIAVPMTDGASVPLGDDTGHVKLFITYCDEKPVWTTASGVCAGSQPFDSYRGVALGRIVDAPPPAGARWAEGARAIFGMTEERAYLQLDGGALTKVPTPVELDLSTSNEPFVIWKRPGGKVAYVSRRGPPGFSVAHVRGTERTRVGAVDALPYGSVLVLGSTAFRVTREGGFVSLRAVERPDRWFHFFPSLTAGRINFTNRALRLPGAGQKVRVLGVGEREAPPPVEGTTPTVVAPVVWSLPIAPWFARSLPTATTPRTDGTHVLGSIGLTPDAKEITIEDEYRRVGGARAMRSAKDNESANVAGHIVEYHRQLPQYEQLVPPITFAVLALLIVLAITASIRVATPRPPDDLTSDFVVLATTFGASLIAAALIAGVSLMSHMAAVDTLIGKTDYYHRQLFYSFVALTVLAAILIRDRSPNPLAAWRTFFPFSIGVAVAGIIVLYVWQGLDALLWIALTDSVDFSDPLLMQTLSFGGALALMVPALVGGFLDQHRVRRVALVVTALVGSLLLWIATRRTLAMAAVALALLSLAVVFAHKLPKLAAITRWIRARYDERTGWKLTLAVGVVLLVAGIKVSSGREGGGVKPAEFAVWFIALGLAGLLTGEFLPLRSPVVPLGKKTKIWLRVAAAAYLIVTLLVTWTLRYMAGTVALVLLPFFALVALLLFIRQQADDFPLRRWFRVFFVLLLLQLLITALYAAQGDFGPLLVLSPTIALVVICWSVAPSADDSSVWMRFVAPALVFVTAVWLFASGVMMIRSPWAPRISLIEGSIARASKRLTTFAQPWFTKEGSWGVSAQWLANDYFGAREPMIANLHSDLAFIASLRVFGTATAASGLLALYLLIMLTVMACAWVLVRNSAKDIPDDVKGQRRIAALDQRLRSREAAFLAIFCALYLMLEILFHIGSGFNAVPQTGVTLPWLSSGGSAAVAFAGLFGIAFSRALHSVDQETS